MLLWIILGILGIIVLAPKAIINLHVIWLAYQFAKLNRLAAEKETNLSENQYANYKEQEKERSDREDFVRKLGYEQVSNTSGCYWIERNEQRKIDKLWKMNYNTGKLKRVPLLYLKYSGSAEIVGWHNLDLYYQKEKISYSQLQSDEYEVKNLYNPT